LNKEAIVMKTMSNQKAEVLVKRDSACGGNCASCGGCKYNDRIYSIVNNPISAQVGDTVLISSSTSAVLFGAITAYIFPLFMFFMGFIDAILLGFGQKGQILMSLTGLGLGIALTVVLHRKKIIRPITLEISSITKKRDGDK